ncbi:MAG: type II secretion system protein GspF, partial [Myxococcaceae bacterium]
MPVFEYKALNEGGKQVGGLKEADSPKSLRSLLRKDGLFLTEVVGQLDAARAAAGGAASKSVDLRKL